ncbi:MAG: hypothetical protein AAB410_03155, partial [Patescibacteria group bacterium]
MVDFETGETGGARFDITTNSNTQVGTYTFRVSAANTGNSTCASYLDYTVVIKPSRKTICDGNWYRVSGDFSAYQNPVGKYYATDNFYYGDHIFLTAPWANNGSNLYFQTCSGPSGQTCSWDMAWQNYGPNTSTVNQPVNLGIHNNKRAVWANTESNGVQRWQNNIGWSPDGGASPIWGNPENTAYRDGRIYSFRRGSGNIVEYSCTASALPFCDPNITGNNSMYACVYSGRNFNNITYVNLNEPALSSPAPNSASPIPFTNWGDAGPAHYFDDYSVRWKGSFNFNAGIYQFTAGSDDGNRFYFDDNWDGLPDDIDGAPGGDYIVNQWVDRGYIPNTSGNINVGGGAHRLIYEYYENGGGSAYSLSWNKVGDLPTYSYTVTPANLSFSASQNAALSSVSPSQSQNFVVTNTGNQALTIGVNESLSWADIGSTSLSLNASQSVNLSVTINTTSISAGSYTGNINFTNAQGAGNQSKTVNYTITAAPPPAPTTGPVYNSATDPLGGGGAQCSQVRIAWGDIAG